MSSFGFRVSSFEMRMACILLYVSNHGSPVPKPETRNPKLVQWI